MWLIIGGIVIILVTYLIDTYGVFKHMNLYSDSLNNPIFLYFSWKGPKEKLSQPFG